MIDKPITITLDSGYGRLIRAFAKAQNCTYESAVAACVQLALAAGGPVILDEYGDGTVAERRRMNRSE